MTRARALEVIREVYPTLKRAGFLVGLYGSLLLSDEGKDIDLMAEPWRPDASPAWAVGLLLADGWKRGDEYEGAMGTHSVQLSRDDDVLDIRFGHVLTRRAETFRELLRLPHVRTA